MQQDNIWLFLVDDFLQIMIVRKSNVLARYVYGRCDTVDFHAVDYIQTGNAVLTEAYYDLLKHR